MHLAANEIRHGRPAAFVRDMNDVDAGARLEQLESEMRRVARAARGEGELPRLRFRERHQLGHVLHRHRRMRHQDVRRDAGQRDRREVADVVVGHLVEEGLVHRERSECADGERVAVGR